MPDYISATEDVLATYLGERAIAGMICVSASDTIPSAFAGSASASTAASAALSASISFPFGIPGVESHHSILRCADPMG